MIYKKLPKKIDKIFIDLDDTLVDFMEPAADLVGFKKIRTKQDMIKFCKMIDDPTINKKLWDKIVAAGPEWWVQLPKLPWADALMEAANRVCKDVVILTSPGNGSGADVAAQGKMRWSLGQFKSNNLVMAYKKHMCASPGALLIDDWDKFTIPWEERGGSALLLNRPWRTGGYAEDEIIDALNKYGRINKF